MRQFRGLAQPWNISNSRHRIPWICFSSLTSIAMQILANRFNASLIIVSSFCNRNIGHIEFPSSNLLHTALTRYASTIFSSWFAQMHFANLFIEYFPVEWDKFTRFVVYRGDLQQNLLRVGTLSPSDWSSSLSLLFSCFLRQPNPWRNKQTAIFVNNVLTFCLFLAPVTFAISHQKSVVRDFVSL